MKDFLKSFVYAFRGIGQGFNRQRNIWIMLIAALLAIGLAVFLRVDTQALVIIVLTSGIVLSMEMVNTAMEILADKLHPEQHPEIGRVKDVMAGAVLVLSIFALIVGVIILGPPLLEQLTQGRI